MAGSGTALSSQQIAEMKQNSPSYQMEQKWRGIFSNATLCEHYIRSNTLVGGQWKDTIPVPDDPTERQIAQRVAEQVASGQEVSELGAERNEGSRMQAQNACINAAKLFLRKCASYTKKRERNIEKETNKFMKENKGAGAYDISKLTPATKSTADTLAAGTNAGNQAVMYYRTGDQANMNVLQKQTQSFMQDKCYNVAFWYTFYNGIGQQEGEAERNRQTKLQQLKPQYNRYKADANPGTYDMNALNRVQTGQQVMRQ